MAHEGAGMARRPRISDKSTVISSASARVTDTLSTRRTVVEFQVDDEGARTRLIGDLSCLLREAAIPDSARSAGLELIGWLARRMPHEAPHSLGVEEALQAKRAARKGR